MLNETFKTHLSQILNTQIEKISPLSGGDINEVYKITTRAKNLVIKVNRASKFPNMFELEALGLKHIADSNSFLTPKVIQAGICKDQSFLLLEYLESGTKTASFLESFGHQLAAMHQNTDAFGFEKDNYIGSLPQYNAREENAVDFYINQRLQPQFKMANQRGYSFSNIEDFYTKISKLIPDEPAALVHGDLWSGNFMVGKNGEPILIDPATCYAPREMDIALMHLFGGFDSDIFNHYNDVFPLQQGWEERMRLWQLYYILVHVNLFGGNYYASAKAILAEYR
ncbi:hypothetical protein DSM03_1011127 [Leeuwenhoekiella aestuarii]|uniref:Protein kinase domain-containing protein n=1 Tax=Leeuwenhoekiella aestuarii TaxID=2249426 RepID=A0A4Q0P0D2_9FLAO|nr:fructosamine kinase family protein [Leeuwenhoekiella aestuarii]RXG18441.1 hypothetical protein DSM04_101638 [Leeuwenhoekiella aestuarii]RXG19746.1 hypothetical protein DSM03_1011127 [Leeuwenhoekiella aestuarii]